MVAVQKAYEVFPLQSIAIQKYGTIVRLYSALFVGLPQAFAAASKKLPYVGVPRHEVNNRGIYTLGCVSAVGYNQWHSISLPSLFQQNVECLDSEW